MKKNYLQFLAGMLMCGLCAGCGASGATDSSPPVSVEEVTNAPPTVQTELSDASALGSGDAAHRVAKDDAVMQTESPGMSTRILEDGTKINLHFGDTVLPGILNDSETAQALIDMLPYTVHMNSYSHDFCGVMPDELPYEESEVHYGWLNGDIDYAIDAPYLTILHSDEDISEQYGYQVNIGVLDCELERIRDLNGSYDVLIELAE